MSDSNTATSAPLTEAQIWYSKHREISIRRTLAWRAKNMDRHKAYKSAYYVKNRERIRAEVAGKNQQRRLRAIQLLGGRCLDCGEEDARVLCFHHRHFDGFKDKRRTAMITEILRGVRDDIELVCANCHMRRHY